jgi:hypothetical protein
MRLLVLILAGPIIWSVTFSLVYALHGTGCALGWTEVDLHVASLHHVLMWAAWATGLGACGILLARLPAGTGRRCWLPRAGGWIGLGATLFTLFPVAVTSTCISGG